jgi:hypothetical protein
LNLDQLLDQLGYTQSQNYRSTNESSQEPLTEHLFRAAKKAGVQGAYVFQTSPPEQKILPPRPAVYVAEAKTREEAREIHQRLWNFGNAPFLVILLPNEIRVYTGFDFSLGNEKKGLVNEIQDIANLTFESIREKLRDFGSDSIDSGEIWQTQAKHITPENRVDIHLLNNLEKLEKHLKIKGVDISIIHALIGKYVYIRYLYDRQILSREWLAENNINLDTILGRNATLEGLLKLTELLENRFNGAIFPLPSNVEEILGDDEIVSLVASAFKGDDLASGQLHLDFNAYDFSYIPVETLSSIYEQFLHSQGTGKKVGAVYTPEPVADYLLCELQESKPLEKGMKILDPCCGSGIFLVLAYRRLIELELANSISKKLKPTELRRILCDSLYGVERNREACYVTEFSLILTLLNYIDPPDLHRNKQFKFPSLHNTQIFECDFFDDESDFWKQSKKFDWIVGNPPWIELKSGAIDEDLVLSWMRNNAVQRSTTGKRVCEAFSWRVVDLLAPDGYVGLLTHAMSLFNHESTKYRKLFFDQHEVRRVTNFSNLAYVLFGGRGEAPAATIVYRKALFNSDIDKPEIIHYAPFVANQISNRPWKRDKKNPTWAITINSNEIQTVRSNDAESGEGIIWKLALWGSYRDIKALRRIRRILPITLGQIVLDKGWNLCQGLLLRNGVDLTTEELIHIPDLGVNRLLNVDALTKEKQKFSIPENVLEDIPPQMCFLRRRSGMSGLKIIKAPHIIFNAAYCIYSDENFVIPAPYTGISVENLEDSDYLRALSVFMSSSIIQYLLFFESPSWGVDRNRVYAKDIKKIPIPLMSIKQISQLASLQRELVDLERANTLPTSSLQEMIDNSIENILNLPDDLNILARDFTQIKLSLNKGKAVAIATEHPQENDLLSYGLCLRDELDDFIEDSGLKHKVLLTYSKNLIVCSIEFISSDNRIDVIIEKDQENSSLLLTYIQEQMKQHFSQWVYVQRSLRIFERSRVYICKSARLVDWTRTQALKDSDDIISEILCSNRQLSEVI